MFRAANGYSESQIQCAFARPGSIQSKAEMADSDMEMAMLPFWGDVSFRIGRPLLKAVLRPVFGSKGKLATWLRPIKDSLGLQTPGIYRIPRVGWSTLHWSNRPCYRRTIG